MEIWATAQLELIQSSVDQEQGNLTLKVLGNNTSTPMILVNEEGSIKTHNIAPERASDSAYIQQKIRQFANENEPIHIVQEGELLETLYYGNSEVLNKLKYYPLALLLIIFLFGAVIFFFFKTNKASEQNKLWAGMAKETAHQIGTPLTSLLGWNELLKSEDINPDITKEIEKDINRLQTITDRFSKIGSVPTLDKVDVILATQDAYDYLKARSSKLVEFEFEAPEIPLYVNLNTQLYSWTIENLVKNAIDAMKGKGQLKISVTNSDKNVYIQVTDTGKGIPKARFKKIFEPGFTSKKRGWGLGLSLSRRIIEDYHQGKIKVLNSEIKKGTTIQITLKLIA